jgi:hypothetical protein
MKYNVGNSSISLSLEAVRELYKDKPNFVSDMLLAFDGIFEEKAFKKALDRAWKEAFPGSEKDVPKETPPDSVTNEEAPE